jgi:hypothetical protein
MERGKDVLFKEVTLEGLDERGGLFVNGKEDFGLLKFLHCQVG